MSNLFRNIKSFLALVKTECPAYGPRNLNYWNQRLFVRRQYHVSTSKNSPLPKEFRHDPKDEFPKNQKPINISEKEAEALRESIKTQESFHRMAAPDKNWGITHPATLALMAAIIGVTAYDYFFGTGPLKSLEQLEAEKKRTKWD